MENSQNERPFFNEAPPRKTFARFNTQRLPRTLVAKAIAANLTSLNCRAVNGIAAGLAAALISLTATGQEASDSANAATPVMQEVVVTGSMIKRVDAETAEAVTIEGHFVEDRKELFNLRTPFWGPPKHGEIEIKTADIAKMSNSIATEFVIGVCRETGVTCTALSSIFAGAAR